MLFLFNAFLLLFYSLTLLLLLLLLTPPSCREVNDGGLGLMYKVILDSARPEILATMELILSSLEGDRPVRVPTSTIPSPCRRSEESLPLFASFHQALPEVAGL